MPSHYKYSSYTTPTGGVRRTSYTQSSYSTGTGGPGTSFNNNYSSYGSKSTFSSSSNSSSSNWKSDNNGVVFSGSARDIFEKIGDADSAKGYKDQDYNKLKESCRRSGRLFEDPAFPADDRSLFFSQPSPRRFVWKRPGVRICSSFLKCFA